MIYLYKTQRININPARVAQCLDGLERVCRSTEFSYYKTRLTKVQVDGMSATWAKDDFALFTEKAKKLAVEGKVSPENAYQAVVDVLLNILPEKKAAASATKINPLYAKRSIVTDIAVSMALNLPFDSEPTGIKQFQNQKIAIRKIISSTKAVVDCGDVNSADIFLFVFVNDEIPSARLLGWKRQKEVRTMNRGNKITDSENCRWAEMSYWCELSQLNPISSLLRENGIDKVPDGVLFERTPDTAEIPIPDNMLNSTMMAEKKDVSEKFYEILGMEEATPKTVSTPAPETDSGGLEF